MDLELAPGCSDLEQPASRLRSRRCLPCLRLQTMELFDERYDLHGEPAQWAALKVMGEWRYWFPRDRLPSVQVLRKALVLEAFTFCGTPQIVHERHRPEVEHTEEPELVAGTAARRIEQGGRNCFWKAGAHGDTSRGALRTESSEVRAVRWVRSSVAATHQWRLRPG